jgi:hypothetical protein
VLAEMVTKDADAMGVVHGCQLKEATTGRSTRSDEPWRNRAAPIGLLASSNARNTVGKFSFPLVVDWETHRVIDINKWISRKYPMKTIVHWKSWKP